MGIITKDGGISANPGNVIPAVMKRAEKDAENPRVSQENPTIVRNVFARHNYHMTNARSGLPFSYAEKTYNVYVDPLPVDELLPIPPNP